MTAPATTRTLTFTPESLDELDFETLSELPPFARFVGEPTMTICHVAGPEAAAGMVAAWTCDKDGFAYTDLPASESAFLLTGAARLTSTDGEVTEVRAGQGYLLPQGWSGTFEATEPVSKIFYLL